MTDSEKALRSLLAADVSLAVIKTILSVPEWVFVALEECPVEHEELTKYSVVGAARIIRTTKQQLIKLAEEVMELRTKE